jgi:hypothetical protein
MTGIERKALRPQLAVLSPSITADAGQPPPGPRAPIAEDAIKSGAVLALDEIQKISG